VLEAAAKAGVERIVYTSTESILKNIHARNGEASALIDESVELAIGDVWGAYCRSKYLAEREALAPPKSGLPVVIVNPTNAGRAGDGLITPPTRMLIGFLKRGDAGLSRLRVQPGRCTRCRQRPSARAERGRDRRALTSLAARIWPWAMCSICCAR